MNIREAIRNVKIGLTVVTGVAAVFGCAFVATTLIATAAEEEQAGVEAAVNEPSVESIDRPASDGRRPGPEARGPSFTDIDRDGDGTISEEEFGSYLSYAPPRRFREAPRGRDGWGDRRPRFEGPPPRRERFEDSDFGRALREDGYRPRDEHFRPPPPSRGGQYDDRFSPSRRPPGPPPHFARGGQGGGRGPRGFDGPGGRGPGGGGQCDHGEGHGGRGFGPPPRRQGAGRGSGGYGPEGYGPPPRRPGY